MPCLIVFAQDLSNMKNLRVFTLISVVRIFMGISSICENSQKFCNQRELEKGKACMRGMNDEGKRQGDIDLSEQGPYDGLVFATNSFGS